MCGNHPHVTPSGLIPPMPGENHLGVRLVLHITAPPDPEEPSKSLLKANCAPLKLPHNSPTWHVHYVYRRAYGNTGKALFSLIAYYCTQLAHLFPCHFNPFSELVLC